VDDGDKGEEQAAPSQTTGFLSPQDYDTGATGKRVMLGGVAMPFSLRKEPETASMITLASRMDPNSTRPSTADSGSSVAGPSVEEQAAPPQTSSFLSPADYDTGSTGKRIMLGGVAMPFSLRKEPETASMITLASRMDQSSIRPSTADSGSFVAPPSFVEAPSVVVSEDHSRRAELGELDKAREQEGVASPLLSPISPWGRPGLERFVTAEEEISKSP
jgi:hypothetical protein